MKEINAEIYLNEIMTVPPSNYLTRKLRNCWHYGKKPKIQF